MKLVYDDTYLDIEVNDSSYRYRAIKGEHSLTLYYSLPEHVEIPIGAYCIFENETYTLEKPENFKMHNSRNFEYTLIMESDQAKLKKYKFRELVYAAGTGAWGGSRRLKFNLMARPQEHLRMLVDNLNKRDGGWTVGECVTAAEKSISYNHTSCDAALSQMADAFETEWEIVDKTISLHKVEYNKENPLPLSYGKGKGFKPGVGRTNFNDSKTVEILFVQGGEKNIDASKYGDKELLLPKAQTLRYDGKYFEDEDGFDEKQARAYISDGDGLSIRRQDKTLRSMEEDSLDLSEIYPSRVGTVTGVEVTKEGFCDFFDTTIPDALDFSTPESRFKGETMTVIFQSGMLAGKEFEIQQDDKRVFGYVHSERRFKVVEQEIDGFPMPKDAYMPIVGDTYAVFGISLPDSYVCNNTTKTGASWEMFRQAVKYLYENEEQKFTFTGELDGIWAKKNWLNVGGRIKLGGYVLFSDPQFQPDGIGIRIVGIKDFINNPHSPEVELSNSIVGSSIMSSLRKIESNEVVTDSQHKEALQFTKRRYRDTVETMEMLNGAMLDNFSNAVNPLSVQTMAMLVGDESLQFRFVDNTTNPTAITHHVSYDSKAKKLNCPGGIIQHMTLGIDSISSSYGAGEYMFWKLPEFDTPVLTDSSKKYYLYAKVLKNSQQGDFYLSPAAIAMEEEDECYHLLMGVLNSEYEGERSYVSLYGFTEILPGRITTDRIQDSERRLTINLADNPPTIIARNGAKFVGDFVFENGSGLDNIEGVDELRNTIYSAETKAQEAKDYINNVLPSEMEHLRNQVDGVVESWFYPYTPSPDNFPASEWLAELDKNSHIGDTFTNTQLYADDKTTPDAGKSWRWVIDGRVHKWTQIADSDAVKALLGAAKAQDTADAKRRIFVNTPRTPYDAGDMWAQGGDGEIMRCIKSRKIGDFDPTDWDKASKYTDDTVVNELMQHLADDSMITKEEKSTIRNAMSQIDNEYIAYVEDASRYLVDSGSLTDAYNILKTYLVDVVRIYETNKDTELTEAEKNAYNSNFSVYYVEVSRLVTAISDAIASAKLDSFQYLKDAFGNETFNIAGGVALGGFMGVKNASGEVVAGMSGRDFLQNPVVDFAPNDLSCPMIFAGNKDGVENANTAKTRIYPNGLIETTALMASGGNVGGFYINNSLIREYNYNAENGGSGFRIVELTAEGLVTRKNSYAEKFAADSAPMSRKMFGIYTPQDDYSSLPNSDGNNYYVAAIYSEDTSLNSNVVDNIGIRLDVFGHANKSKNIALDIWNGSIRGFRLANRYMPDGGDLTNMDNYVIVNTSSGNRTITLPKSPQNGQYIVTHKIHYNNALYINGNGKKIYWQNNSAPVSEVFFVGIRVATFLYCQELGAWVGQLSFSDV